MSRYDFIAADKVLKPLEVGIENNGRTIVIQNDAHTLGIYESEADALTRRFTDLPVVAEVQIGRVFSSIEDSLFAYVKETLNDNGNLEIWATWNGEDNNIEKTTKHADELTIDDIRWVFSLEDRSHPRGLKLYKWTKNR